MKNFIFIIILILSINITFGAYVCDTSFDDPLATNTSMFAFWYPIDCTLKGYENQEFVFGINQDATSEDYSRFNPEITEDHCGISFDNFVTNLDSYPYLQQSGNKELPFEILSYTVKCDDTLGRVDWIKSMPTFTRYQDGEYIKYSSDTYRFVEHYNCNYGEEYNNQSITQEIEVWYASNLDHLGTINPGCQLQREGYSNLNCTILDPLGDNPQLLCREVFKIDLDLVFGSLESINLSIDTNISYNNPNKTQPDEPGQGDLDNPSGIGSEPDEQGIRKQVYINYLQNNIQKKNNFLNVLVTTSEIFFSFILLTYYFIEIGIFAYVIANWIPEFFSIPYNMFINLVKK